MPTEDQEQTTKIAVMAIRMEHLVEKVDSIAANQALALDLHKSVAIHDEMLDTVEKRTETTQERIEVLNTTIQGQFQALSGQLSEAIRAMEDRSNSAVVRLHERADGQDIKINNLQETVDKSLGGLKVGQWIVGLLFGSVMLTVAWLFGQVGANHDSNIRLDERVHMVEQKVNKEH